MKKPTPASLKKVTPENLAALGAERLAEILAGVADSRPELKRRLRMELAAEQGADHLAAEIDKRLKSLETSRSRVSWRQRPAFLRELDGVRALIAGRLAGLNAEDAAERMWRLLATARRVESRMTDREGKLAAAYERAAEDLGGLLTRIDPERAGRALAAALAEHPRNWAAWLPHVLKEAPPELARAALPAASAKSGALPGWNSILRRLADAAGDVDAFRATFGPDDLKTPSVAAELANRLLAADRVDEAAAVLKGAEPKPVKRWVGTKARTGDLDFDWESACIAVMERSGRAEEAQKTRWASFERTLSAERARDYTRRLADFDDVEAEQRAFEIAAAHPDFERGLAFLMDWPALPEAVRMIEARPEEIALASDRAQVWAAKLRRRHPAAAHLLLRRAAAAAFRRRDYAASERLTQEADSIALP